MAAINAMHQKDCRTDEQKEADKEKEEEEKDRTEKSYLLYVARAQSKYERQMELKALARFCRGRGASAENIQLSEEKMPPKDP
ncbi:unnamed protein product, partial [Symbiodinium necroappetens]